MQKLELDDPLWLLGIVEFVLAIRFGAQRVIYDLEALFKHWVHFLAS